MPESSHLIAANNRFDDLDLVFRLWCDITHTTRQSTDCPRTIPEALAGPDSEKWRKSLDIEAKQHAKNGTFSEPVDPSNMPPGRKAIPFDCILKIK